MNHCGVLNCPREGTGLDKLYGRLCSLHYSRASNGYERLIRPGDERLLQLPSLLTFNQAKIKAAICEPNLDIQLRPLLLFVGPITIGRTISQFNFARALMDTNEVDLNKGIQSLTFQDNPRHLLGFHARQDKYGYCRFLGRFRATPKVHKLIPGLSEYIQELIAANRGWWYAPGQRLSEISEIRIRSNRYWRAPKPKERKPREYITEFYPYITAQPTEEHNFLIAVDSLVPKALPNQTRADVCQDMIVAILSGEVTLDNLKDALPKYLKMFLKGSPSKYGHLSLDAPAGRNDTRTLAQAIGL